MNGSKDAYLFLRAVIHCTLQYLESSLFQPFAASVLLWELEALKSSGEVLLLWRPYVSYNNELC